MINIASIKDINQLLELEEECFENFISEKLNYKNFKYAFKSKGIINTFVENDIILGYVYCLFNKQSFHVRIYSIAVRKNHQSKKIGSSLMLHVEQLAKSSCKKGISLEVREDNANAILFYESLGYKIHKIKPNYYHDNCSAIQYRKKI